MQIIREHQFYSSRDQLEKELGELERSGASLVKVAFEVSPKILMFTYFASASDFFDYEDAFPENERRFFQFVGCLAPDELVYDFALFRLVFGDAQHAKSNIIRALQSLAELYECFCRVNDFDFRLMTQLRQITETQYDLVIKNPQVVHKSAEHLRFNLAQIAEFSAWFVRLHPNMFSGFEFRLFLDVSADIPFLLGGSAKSEGSRLVQFGNAPCSRGEREFYVYKKDAEFGKKQISYGTPRRKTQLREGELISKLSPIFSQVYTAELFEQRPEAFANVGAALHALFEKFPNQKKALARLFSELCERLKRDWRTIERVDFRNFGGAKNAIDYLYCVAKKSCDLAGDPLKSQIVWQAGKDGRDAQKREVCRQYEEEFDVAAAMRKYKYQKVNVPYLSENLDLAAISEKIVAIKSLTGTGKTRLFENIIKAKSDARIIIILSRISLCHDFYRNFKKYGFSYYRDAATAANTHNIPPAARYIVCVNSIKKLNFSLVEYDIILIDECESLLQHLVQHNLQKQYFQMVFLAKKAKQCFFLDFGFGNKSMQMISDIGDDDVRFIHNSYVNPHKRVKLQSFRSFYDTLVSYVDQKKRVFIGCDTKANVYFYKQLLEERGIDGKDIQIITADDRDSFCDNPAQFGSEDDEVFKRNLIVSPSVTYGVDIRQKYDGIFCHYENQTSTFTEQFQQLSRVRKCDDVFIYSRHAKRRVPRARTFAEIADYFDYKLQKNHDLIDSQGQLDLGGSDVVYDGRTLRVNQNNGLTRIKLMHMLHTFKNNHDQRQQLISYLKTAYTNVVDEDPQNEEKSPAAKKDKKFIEMIKLKKAEAKQTKEIAVNKQAKQKAQRYLDMKEEYMFQKRFEQDDFALMKDLQKVFSEQFIDAQPPKVVHHLFVAAMSQKRLNFLYILRQQTFEYERLRFGDVFGIQRQFAVTLGFLNGDESSVLVHDYNFAVRILRLAPYHTKLQPGLHEQLPEICADIKKHAQACAQIIQRARTVTTKVRQENSKNQYPDELFPEDNMTLQALSKFKKNVEKRMQKTIQLPDEVFWDCIVSMTQRARHRVLGDVAFSYKTKDGSHVTCNYSLLQQAANETAEVEMQYFQHTLKGNPQQLIAKIDQYLE